LLQLDEFEDGDARFGLGLEATPIEQLVIHHSDHGSQYTSIEFGKRYPSDE
jgi:transposase InsO family protein